MDIKNDLNEKQFKAVSTDKQYVRVVAGAGTGKTRVLTYRIAYLISVNNIEPWNILAITFTNKAANEMLDRVSGFFPEQDGQFWISTFHRLCNRFLRSEIKVLNYNSNFHIIDEEDQESLIKKIMKDKGYARTDELTKMAIAFIQKNKEKGLMPSEADKFTFPLAHLPLLKSVYEEYEVTKDNSNSLDFDDLIIKTVQILTNYEDIRLKWQRRFKYILVDEFQDTNDIQYHLIRLLMNSNTSLYVVGDPDQTIYTWRGAKQEIIINLEKDFPSLETIVLDLNYRSTQSILDPANKLISNNKKRIHKDLEAHHREGVAVEVQNENYRSQEANFICRRIQKFVNQGYRYSDMAILYRSNYLSLDLEKQFMRYSIPYTIYGNVKFYQRKEVKDMIAYFCLVDNALDDLSFLRVVNSPKRSFGDTSIKALESNAQNHKLSLAQYVQSAHFDIEMKPKQVSALREMLVQIEKLQDALVSYYASSQEIDDLDTLKDAFEQFVLDLKYYEYLEESFENSSERRENVEALLGDVIHFMARDFNNSFSEYLQNVAVMSHQDEIDTANKVKLMTVHIAKGLEFPIVFIYSFNEGVFPSSRSVAESAEGIEEERRLAYVAMTRAMNQLIITYNSDYNYALKQSGIPSSFLVEAGIEKRDKKSEAQQKFKEFFQKQKEQYDYRDDYTPSITSITNDIVWEVGDRVLHKNAGPGTVINLLPNGIIEVKLDSGEIKKYIGAHHTLEREKAS